MLQINQSILCNKVKKYAEQLQTCFGIDKFLYNHMTLDGDFFAVSNQPEFYEYYYLNNFYKYSPFYRHPDNFDSCVVFPGFIPYKRKEYIDNLMTKKFGWPAENMMLILKKEKNAIHKFLFCTKLHTKPAFNFYLNNLNLLQCFCDYFKTEMSHYHKEVNDYTINIGKLIGSEFNQINPIVPKNNDQKKIFLQSMGVPSMDASNFSSLSSQEKACLQWIFRGRSLKETAKKMHLSPRTVEHYLESIKGKLGCLTRTELLDHLHYLELMGQL